ncbi:PIR Superfamily Protein [Plasmodium ovale curtisi]|uniref:PIR Superfamily Protein n=1 Tax=Plasmodium ovale curtisi TaxID=864141 RepID=A0A1A8WP67_PLAOA|nr:PIR Superfamily Protein [Plasmodium ovale curtisi]
MPPKKVTGKYGFCINAPYYQMLVQLFIKRKKKLHQVNKCDNFLSGTTFLNNPSAKQICEEFTFLHDSLCKKCRDEKHEDEPLTEDDCNFLNYWLNDKLREYVRDNSNYVKQFYKKIKELDATVFSKHEELENRINFIDPDIFENMKYLYDLYDNSRTILNMMRGQDYPDEEITNEENVEGEQESEENKNEKQKSCSDYTEDCSKKYKKAMDKCLNDNDDFYKALKDFKISYNIAVEQETQDLRNCKSSQYFHLPNYDPVLEKQRNIMAGKILSAPLILSFVIPLLYKYTPFGPFFRAKAKIIKNRWINPDKDENELLLLSTDNEDNISENGEYNIGYFSGTNL